MKKVSLFFGALGLFITGVLFLLSFAACTGSTSTKSNTADISDRYPAGLIEGNLNDAAHALHVVVKDVRLDDAKSLRTDSGKIGYAALAFDCTVVEAYKGDLKAGEGISFISFWEYYNTLLEEQRKADSHRIVFLNKGLGGSYHALSFGVFDFSEPLDESIKNLAGPGG